MRIDDYVRGDTFTGERHILLPVLDTTGTLLTMPAGKFVSNLWDSHRTHPNFAKLVSFLVKGYHDLVHNTSLTSS